jgi:DnaJ-class molecular chaperone
MPEIKWRDLNPSQARQPRNFRWTEVRAHRTLYEVLEVSPKASPEVIRAAYRAMMEKYHPDKHHERRRPWAEEVSRELNAAYAILSNPQKRSEYDFANGIVARV